MAQDRRLLLEDVAPSAAEAVSVAQEVTCFKSIDLHCLKTDAPSDVLIISGPGLAVHVNSTTLKVLQARLQHL